MLDVVPPSSAVSPNNVAAMVHAAMQREARLRAAAALEAGGDYQVHLDRLRDLDRPAILTLTTQLDAAALLKATADRVPIYPAKLNGVFAGGLAPGHCVVVFGRPGAGKTLVVCNLAAGFLMSGKVVLHIMNEESQEALTMRYLSLLVPSSHGLLSNLAHHDSRVRDNAVNYCMDYAKEKRNLGNLHIAHGVYSYAAVRELVARLKPDMVIVDQIRHIGRGGGDPLHETLERVTQDLRAHAHEAGFTAVGVTQAGATAEGKPVLDLADIDGAKTGLQGACDAIVGLGKGPNDEAEHKRTISVCRNKISGVITHFPVWLDEQHTLIKNTL
jgi:KaiC/GvpD/RAD55 family RecA-like ATPase